MNLVGMLWAEFAGTRTKSYSSIIDDCSGDKKKNKGTKKCSIKYLQVKKTAKYN